MCRSVLISALLPVLAELACAQPIDFELRTFPESPVVFADTATAPAPGLPQRQLVTIRDDSQKSVAAVMFEQSVANGSKIEIVAIERVSILFAAREKRRVSVAVGDMSRKLQSGESLGRPVLSIVAVEFLDGSQWSAPTASQPLHQ